MKKTMSFLLIMCVIMSLGVYAQGTKLEYKFQKGKIYRYCDVLDAKSTQEMMGQEVKTEMHGMNIVRIVSDGLNPDGSMAVIASIDSAVMSIKAPGVDTTQTPQDIIGKRFRMSLTTDGNVSNFTSLDGGEDAMGQSNKSRLGHYPRLSEKPVTIGSTWTANEIDTVAQKQFGGEIVTDTKEEYKVIGKEQKNGHDCFSLAMTGTFMITGKGSMMGMDLHFEGTGKTEGTLFFDPAEGIVIASESKIDMDMSIATTGQSSMVIPTTQSMTLVRTYIQ